MRKIVNYPALSLFQKTKEVTEFDSSLHSLLDEMKEIMLEAKGIGLAANQIAEDKSLFIMKSQAVFKDGKGEIIEFINPKILNLSKTYQHINEGCLSTPGLFLTIPRDKEIHVQYQDRYGNIKEGILTGIEAVCFQHEFDHLQGIFFIDRASRNERRAALKILGLK